MPLFKGPDSDLPILTQIMQLNTQGEGEARETETDFLYRRFRKPGGSSRLSSEEFWKLCRFVQGVLKNFYENGGVSGEQWITWQAWEAESNKKRALDGMSLPSTFFIPASAMRPAGVDPVLVLIMQEIDRIIPDNRELLRECVVCGGIFVRNPYRVKSHVYCSYRCGARMSMRNRRARQKITLQN